MTVSSTKREVAARLTRVAREAWNMVPVTDINSVYGFLSVAKALSDNDIGYVRECESANKPWRKAFVIAYLPVERWMKLSDSQLLTVIAILARQRLI